MPVRMTLRAALVLAQLLVAAACGKDHGDADADADADGDSDADAGDGDGDGDADGDGDGDVGCVPADGGDADVNPTECEPVTAHPECFAPEECGEGFDRPCTSLEARWTLNGIPGNFLNARPNEWTCGDGWTVDVIVSSSAAATDCALGRVFFNVPIGGHDLAFVLRDQDGAELDRRSAYVCAELPESNFDVPIDFDLTGEIDVSWTLDGREDNCPQAVFGGGQVLAILDIDPPPPEGFSNPGPPCEDGHAVFRFLPGDVSAYLTLLDEDGTEYGRSGWSQRVTVTKGSSNAITVDIDCSLNCVLH